MTKRFLPFPAAFTLIELLVVITIIGILAGVALPVYSTVQERAQQTKTLANAKQIGLALKLFAGDNEGQFPSKTGDPAGSPGAADAANANQAFANLFPTYVSQEKIFWLAKSGWCNKTAPDEDASTAAKCLSAGENEFCYVKGLNDTSNPGFPLIANGLSADNATYVPDKSARGGVWGGTKAIVIRVDQSGEVMTCDRGFKAPAITPTGGGVKQSIFTAGPNWLAVENTVLQPITAGGAP